MTDGDRQARRNRRYEDARRQAEADVRAVMATPEGRRFLWWVLNETNVFGSSYGGGGEETLFREGHRAVGVRLMRLAQRLAPRDWGRLLREMADRDDALLEAGEPLSDEDDDDGEDDT